MSKHQSSDDLLLPLVPVTLESLFFVDLGLSNGTELGLHLGIAHNWLPAMDIRQEVSIRLYPSPLRKRMVGVLVFFGYNFWKPFLLKTSIAA